MANNWAIVVGINDYQHHPERKLNYAVNDAQQMGKFLSDQAGFGAEQVILCLGDQAQRGSSTYPTCSNLLRVLEQDLKPDRLGRIDRLWFYFSGHGVSRNGRDYLITSDCLEDKIERFALPIDEVIAALQLHKEADIVLVLDACRQVLGKKNFDSSIGEETIKVARERGITTIFSCDYGQYSYELDALQQGAFTYALIEGLSQHTLPHQLEQYLRQRVQALHLQHRRDRVTQTPRIRIEPAAKALQPLLPDAVTPTDITVLMDQAREAELEEDFETAKRVWWQIIEVAQSNEHIRQARTAIDRIDRKIARLLGDRSVPEPSQPVSAPSQPSKSAESRSLALKRFNFEIVMVNAKGKVTDRRAGQAEGFVEDLGNGVTLEMVKIPGGSFQMGSPDTEKGRYSDESPQHTVTVPSFFMGKFAVTQAQYQAMMGTNPAHFKGEKRPVENVSWNEAVEFCQKLTQKTGRSYRLPSEAEWEYACRAGTTTPFHFGQTITSDLANFDANSSYAAAPEGTYRAETTDVGSFPPNAFGLYDMHGNVREWCLDHWHDDYQGAPIDGSAWFSEDENALRLMRGGSVDLNPWVCRSACRVRLSPVNRYYLIGFRVVCSAVRTL